MKCCNLETAAVFGMSPFISKGFALTSAEQPTINPVLFPTGIPTLDSHLGGGIRVGAIVVVVGASGSGKTSLFRTIFHAQKNQYEMLDRSYEGDCDYMTVLHTKRGTSCILSENLHLDLDADYFRNKIKMPPLHQANLFAYNIRESPFRAMQDSTRGYPDWAQYVDLLLKIETGTFGNFQLTVRKSYGRIPVSPIPLALQHHYPENASRYSTFEEIREPL